jgi:hypothetical protein
MTFVFSAASAPRIVRSWSLVVVASLSVVAGCGKSGSDEPTLPQQIDIAEREADPETRARKLLKLSADQRAIKDLAGGTQTTEKAEDAAGEVKDEAIRTDLMLAIAQEFAVLGRHEQAQDAAGNAQLSTSSITDVGRRLEAKAKIIALLSETGDNEGAKKTLQALGTEVDDLADPAKRAEYSAIVAATAGKAGDNGMSVKYLAQIDEYAGKVVDVPARIKALTAAAGRLYRWKQDVEGRKRLDAAVIAARGLTDPAAKSDALLSIYESLQDLRKTIPMAELLADAKTSASAVTDEKTRTALIARVQTMLNLPE